VYTVNLTTGAVLVNGLSSLLCLLMIREHRLTSGTF
jgi:hypothetical protein